MKYGVLALALAAFVGFAASPASAECAAGHKKTAEVPSQTTVADNPVNPSKPSGS
ncbi:MAG: hypothetical protein JJ855_06265 [Rhodospirillales bacterium]|nr:hypothetical protein [Rhodospirillales bacterium]